MRAFPPPSSGTARLVSREAAVGCNSLDGRSLLLDPCVSPAGVEDPATSTNLDKSIVYNFWQTSMGLFVAEYCSIMLEHLLELDSDNMEVVIHLDLLR